MGMENWEAFCRSILGEKYIEPGSRPQSLKRSREPTPPPHQEDAAENVKEKKQNRL